MINTAAAIGTTVLLLISYPEGENKAEVIPIGMFDNNQKCVEYVEQENINELVTQYRARNHYKVLTALHCSVLGEDIYVNEGWK